MSEDTKTEVGTMVVKFTADADQLHATLDTLSARVKELTAQFVELKAAAASFATRMPTNTDQ